MIGLMRTTLGKARWHLFLLIMPIAFSTAGCGMFGHMARVEPRPEVTSAPTVTPGGPTTVSYREVIAPILNKNCNVCHGGQVGLYVDAYDTLLAGSSRGKVVIPGDPAKSTLLQRIKGEVQPRMHLNRQSMSGGDIALIETWIREGAANN